MKWIEYITPEFRKRFLAAMFGERQVLLLARYDMGKKYPNLKPYLPFINQILMNLNGYDLILAAFIDCNGCKMSDKQYDKIFLTSNLLRIGMTAGVTRKCKRDDNSSLFSNNIIQLASDLYLQETMPIPPTFPDIKNIIDSHQKYRQFIKMQNETPFPWTLTDWDNLVGYSDMYLAPLFSFNYLSSSMSPRISLENIPEIIYKFASVNRAYDELLNWKSNVIQKKPSALLSLTLSSFSGRVSLSDIAKFIYSSSETLSLVNTIYESGNAIKKSIPSVLGPELKLILYKSLSEAEFVAKRIQELRNSL